MWFNNKINLGSGDYHLMAKGIQSWINVAIGQCHIYCILILLDIQVHTGTDLNKGPLRVDQVRLFPLSGLGYKLDSRFDSIRSSSFYTTRTEIDVQYYSTSISAKPCATPMTRTTVGATHGTFLLSISLPYLDRILTGMVDPDMQGAKKDLPVAYGTKASTKTKKGVKISTKPLSSVKPYA